MPNNAHTLSHTSPTHPTPSRNQKQNPKEKSEPISLASALVNNMQEFDPAQYLSGPARLFEVKEAAVRELVEVRMYDGWFDDGCTCVCRVYTLCCVYMHARIRLTRHQTKTHRPLHAPHASTAANPCARAGDGHVQVFREGGG